MHQSVVLKNSIKIYIKTAPTCFGVTVTPSSGSDILVLAKVYIRAVQRTHTKDPIMHAAISPHTDVF